MNHQMIQAKSYHELLDEILLNGTHVDGYTQLLHAYFAFQHCKRGYVYMPAYRLGKKTPTKYAAVEAVWYMSRDRKVDWIGQFGSTWYHMVDQAGKCNSNYGYQLHANQNLRSKWKSLATLGKTTLSILSEKNQHSLNDLVCNNYVELYYDRTYNELSAHVIARSIDMIFGLPYDMLAAQALMNIAAQKIERSLHLPPKTIQLTQLSYEIVNCHIYDRDVTDKDKQLDENHAHSGEWKRIPFSSLAYSYTNEKIKELMSDDEVLAKYIDNARKNTHTETFHNGIVYSVQHLHDARHFDSVEDAIRSIQSRKNEFGKKTIQRLIEGMKNPINRKLVAVTPERTVYYSLVNDDCHSVNELVYERKVI